MEPTAKQIMFAFVIQTNDSVHKSDILWLGPDIVEGRYGKQQAQQSTRTSYQYGS